MWALFVMFDRFLKFIRILNEGNLPFKPEFSNLGANYGYKISRLITKLQLINCKIMPVV